jgi:flagellar basal body P-ring formation protein FlgA
MMHRALALATALICLMTPVLADVPAAIPARIVVPARDIMRGEIISDSDLTVQNAPEGSTRSDLVTSVRDLSGMEARRYLHAGEPVLTSDVRHPILVVKGTTVTMIFSAPGIELTAIGKAMSEGGMGETVTVLNPVSYRQISCTVTGAGQVRAGDATVVMPAQIAAAKP